MLLASQAATAVENAQLYSNLEAKVQERTTALDKALKELWDEMTWPRNSKRSFCPAIRKFSATRWRQPCILPLMWAATTTMYSAAANRTGFYWRCLRSRRSGRSVHDDDSDALRTAALTLERAQRPLTPAGCSH